ncbi:hypothetical protein RB595_003235 [Gaeumannomyces hyphopodioides]
MLQPTTRRIAAASRMTHAISAATTNIAPPSHRTAVASGRRFSQRPGGTGKPRPLLRPQPVLGALSATGFCYFLYRSQRHGAATAAMASSKLVPSNPSDVMVIRDVTPNVVTLSVPFLRFGLLAIGGRATVVRLTSGALAVFSPVALTPEVRAKLAAMGGELRYIVALDIEHHIFISQWAREFPGARIVGPEGLPEKRAKAAAGGADPMIGDEPFAVVFKAEDKKKQQQQEGPVVSEEFDADFASEFVDAHPNKELVFCYRPDRVLIEADLMFNLPAAEQYSRVPEEARPKDGPFKRFFANMQSTAGDATAAKRFIWHVLSRADRTGFNESVRRIDGWDFGTVVPCHGDTIVGDGKEVFRKVFQWHLEEEAAKK